MTKRIKTLLLISSFAVFFILSYLIVLYAYGYQFDFEKFKLVETGGLLIKTNTDSIQILINDRQQGETSLISNTFVQKNLLPETYNVRLEKKDFFSLNKNIEIKSGEVAQLFHIYLARGSEIKDFISNKTSEKETILTYFINKSDGLLYKRLDNGETEKISSEPVYIKNFILRQIENNIYLGSNDPKAPGLFLLNFKGEWNKIYENSTNDLALSPDRKKLAIIGPNEISILWLKDDNDPPYFKKDHKELILRVGEKIENVFWFKTNWHLIYLTAVGDAYFIEADPTGGRGSFKI